MRRLPSFYLLFQALRWRYLGGCPKHFARNGFVLKKKGAFSRIAVAKLLLSQHSNCFDILLEQRTSFRSTSLLTTDYAHTKINSVVALLIFHIKKNYQDPKASMHILFTSLDTKIDILGGI